MEILEVETILRLILACLLIKSFGVVQADGGLIPIPSIPQNCQEDLDCPKSFFCKSVYRQCAKCADCFKLRRRDSESGCAQNTAACGPCLPGYFDLGGHCENASHSQQFDETSGITHLTGLEDDGETKTDYILIIVLSCGGTLMIVGVVICVVNRNKIFKSSLPRQTLGSGEDGSSQCAEPDEISQFPSAPLLPEYERQPPVFELSSLHTKSGRSNPVLDLVGPWIPPLPQRQICYPVLARPFAAGNGAGEWVNQDPEPPQNQPNPNNQEDDQIDGEGVEDNGNIPEVPMNSVAAAVSQVDNNDQRESVELCACAPPTDASEPLTEEEIEEVVNAVVAAAAAAEEDLPEMEMEDEQDDFENDDGVLGEEDFVEGDFLHLNFNLGFGFAARDRHPSAPDPGYMEETFMDFNELLFSNSTNNSASTLDSGTGTSNEEEADDRPPAQVPDIVNNIEDCQVVPDESNDSLYEDAIDMEEE